MGPRAFEPFMRTFLPLVGGCVLVVAIGCQNERGEAPLQAYAQERGAAEEPTVMVYDKLFDDWEEMQLGVLLENARYLEENYRRRKADPPKDANGKPVEVTPANSLHFGGRPGFGGNMPITPALNTFAPHIGGSAMIGNVPVEVARLRVLFDDTRTAGAWTLYRPQLTNGRLTERYFDRIGTLKMSKEETQVTRDAVAESIKNGGSVKSGKAGVASFEVRPLRLFDKSCITCHAKNSQGDLVGVMLYVAAPESP
jgi:hypothetical protein